MNSQTLLGHVGAVSGPTVSVRLSNTLSSGTAIIGGRLYSIAQVGSFVRIPLGFQDLFGVVTDVGATASPKQDDAQSANWLRVQLVGESIGSAFERGIGRHPNVNDEVHRHREGPGEDLREPRRGASGNWSPLKRRERLG